MAKLPLRLASRVTAGPQGQAHLPRARQGPRLPLPALDQAARPRRPRDAPVRARHGRRQGDARRARSRCGGAWSSTARRGCGSARSRPRAPAASPTARGAARRARSASATPARPRSAAATATSRCACAASSTHAPEPPQRHQRRIRDLPRTPGRRLASPPPARWSSCRSTAAASGAPSPSPAPSADTGRWSHRYRFETVRGRASFRFRARIRRQPGFPFITGASRPVRVVRPRPMSAAAATLRVAGLSCSDGGALSR